MPSKPLCYLACTNQQCRLHGHPGKGNIIRHSFIRLKRGRRRRYLCKTCGRTFCSSTGTPYYRLQHSRKAFDEVVTMSVEGVSKSAIARIKGISWNTVARWLEKAARFARRFNSLMTRGYELIELQADEIRTFILRKKCPVWVFLSIEVWSRLWPSTVIGRRSYRNARALMAETAHRGQFERPALITRLCILQACHCPAVWLCMRLRSGHQNVAE